MTDLDELVDVAPFGVARQSSLSKWSRPNGAQALVEEQARDFACHTDLEDRPWWELDLLAAMPLHRIVISNRSDPRFRARANRLVVEVSKDGELWETIHAGFSHFGDGRSDPPMQLELGSMVLARYIRLSLPERQYLHLRKVSVLASKGAKLLADLSRMHGVHLPAREGHIKKGAFYRIVRVGEGSDDRLTGLKIGGLGRLGNSIIQIINALFLARQMGLSHVAVPKFEHALSNASVSDDAVTLHPARREPDGLYLKGSFFNPIDLGGNLLASLCNVERYRLAQRFLLPFLEVSVPSEAVRGERARELAVHIRSGDIFASDSPHRNYVQPPLSFYTTILDGLLEEGAIDRVCIVSEDRLNPCIDALERDVRGRGIPLHMQSGSLFEDVAYMLGARHLVFGRGTFGFGVCLLAGQVDTLHVFDTGAYRGLPNVRRLTVISPRPNTYMNQGEWKNTPEQHRLMLDYPAASLERRDDLPPELVV